MKKLFATILLILSAVFFANAQNSQRDTSANDGNDSEKVFVAAEHPYLYNTRFKIYDYFPDNQYAFYRLDTSTGEMSFFDIELLTGKITSSTIIESPLVEDSGQYIGRFTFSPRTGILLDTSEGQMWYVREKGGLLKYKFKVIPIE